MVGRLTPFVSLIMSGLLSWPTVGVTGTYMHEICFNESERENTLYVISSYNLSFYGHQNLLTADLLLHSTKLTL